MDRHSIRMMIASNQIVNQINKKIIKIILLVHKIHLKQIY